MKNFDIINDLAKNDLVTSLPKFKYHKEHLCPSCEKGKSKKASHPPKPVPNSKQRLHLLHMDLCGPMRVESINGKWYVLVIVDYYSCYTWVHFLRSKDDAPEVIKTFLKKITVLLQAPVIIVRTDNDTEFKNQMLQEYFNSVGISHQALKRLLLHATLKTAPSSTVILTKHHKSSLTTENQISPFFMYSGLSVIPRMIMKTLGNLVQKNIQVILFSIHSDDGNPFRAIIKQALRYKQRCCSRIPTESDSLPYAHAQTTKTYYKHQDLKIKKAQELKTKTSANSNIKDPSLKTKL
ncbi:putative ribonuclease H-like domain-containing protein [Tanacetum coccineum]